MLAFSLEVLGRPFNLMDFTFSYSFDDLGPLQKSQDNPKKFSFIAVLTTDSVFPRLFSSEELDFFAVSYEC